MSPVLQMDAHDEDKELDFELDYLQSLTTQQRFELMFRKSKEIVEVLIRNGHREPTAITKRT